MDMRRALTFALTLAACASHPNEKPAAVGTDAPPTAVAGGTGATAGAAGGNAPATGGNPDRGGPSAPGDRLTVHEARKYMVALINRDRAYQGLPPVELDEGAPTSAGQGHAEDMAKNGYLGHWGSDGSVPESRYTAAGGADNVSENVSCLIDEKARKLDTDPRIEKSEVERSESMFFNETPPNDGHRKNILKASHKKVGIGIAQPLPTATEIAVPCFAQEFTDPYGAYAPIPRRAKVGDVVHVEGRVSLPATPAGVGVARTDTPRPLAVPDLNKRRSYMTPKPYVNYWGPGFQTPLPVAIRGDRFSIDVPLNDGGQKGLYEISVWARMAGSKDYVMIGLRTVTVE